MSDTQTPTCQICLRDHWSKDCPHLKSASSFDAPTLLAAVKREAAFYREQLELICKDTRKTRARRLAESALMFWDQLQLESDKRKKVNNQKPI